MARVASSPYRIGTLGSIPPSPATSIAASPATIATTSSPPPPMAASPALFYNAHTPIQASSRVDSCDAEDAEELFNAALEAASDISDFHPLGS